MKYTFLLPAYKAQYLAEMLDSIKVQTYTDFKVVVSDDCSPENLKSIFDRVCGDDPRFSYRRNEVNLGGKSLVAHWNQLVELCDTEWLIMASDDDVYDPRFLEKVDRLCEKYPRVDLIHARARIIDAYGEVTMLDSAYDELVSQIQFLAFWGKKDHIECVANYAYRTSALRSIGGFVDFPLAWCSDTATNNLMSHNGCATSSDILFSFRMSGENISTIATEKKDYCQKKLDASIGFFHHMNQLFASFPQKGTKLYEHELRRAKEDQMEVVRTNLLYHCRVLDFRKFVRLVKFAKKNGITKSRYEVYQMWIKWLYAKNHHIYQ